MKKVILFAILAVVCLTVILIFVSSVNGKNESVEQFKEYLEQNGFTCSNDICTMQSVSNYDDIAETYTEIYHFKDHTFTAVWVHDDRSNGTAYQMEYVYNYEDNTVTMSRYDTADAIREQKPDTVYLLTREEMLECLKGDVADSEQELLNNMLGFKNVLKTHLDGAGVNLQDIIL